MTVNSPKESRTSPRRDTRVLLVEDNLAANRGLTRFLEVQGYQVEPVVNGMEAIERMRGANPPDIVLTDLQLPDLDGREVVEFASQLRPQPRIGAVTAWDIDARSDPELAERTDWILLKPLDLTELLRRLTGMVALLDATRVVEPADEVSQVHLESPDEIG